MTGTFRLSSGFAQVPHALLLDDRLMRVDRDVAHALLLIARRDPEIEVSNKRLAHLARCSVRAVQAALRRLAEVGWIGIVRGVAGRLQRRISLYFRPENRPENRPMHVCTESATSAPCTYETGGPPDPPPPMYPPIKPEQEPPSLNDDDDTRDVPRPVEYAPPVEEACPPSSSSSGRTFERYAKRSELEAVQAKAAAIWGDDERTRQKVRATARTFRLSWVDQALDVCIARNLREPVGFPLLLAILNNWLREGGPPPRPAARRVEPAWSEPDPAIEALKGNIDRLQESRTWLDE